MKSVFLTFCFIALNSLFAQITDYFSDGDYTNNPIWIGDIDSFEVINQELHLNAPANTNESFLSTQSFGAINGYWECTIRLDFNPSSGNRAFFYIMSDTSNIKLPLNGYYVMIGNTSDEVSLYKQNGSTHTKIIDGIDGICNTSVVSIKVKVTRDVLGNFELFADTSAGFTNYVSQGIVFDNDFMQAKALGFLCDYTATRSDKFWFDNVVNTTQIYQDLLPPQLVSYALVSNQKIQLAFNENIDTVFAKGLTNYSLNSTITPNACNILSSNEVLLMFSNSFQGQNNLHLLAKDIAGNDLDTTISFFVEPPILYHELLINEFYADESPSYGLPAFEFIELKNNTADTIYLQDCFIADQNDTVLIPNDTVLPNDYLILCKTTAVNDFSIFGNAVGVPSFPSLNNTGDQIKLLNANLEIIDSLSYTTDWYRDLVDDYGNAKKDGGYSLERMGVNNLCGAFYEWYPSIDTLGGTPGTENSALQISIPPLQYDITSIQLETDSSLLIQFNNALPFVQASNILVSYENLDLINLVNIENFLLDNAQSQMTLFIEDTFQFGYTYHIVFEGLQDCYGNNISLFSADFFKLKDPELGDFVFNEILFNPVSGGSDFIELANLKNQAIDLNGVQILEYDVLNPSLKTDSVSFNNVILPPNAFLVISTDTFHVKNQYFTKNPQWLVEHNIPNYDDNEGITVLKLPNGQTIDSFYYNKSWHFPLLDDLNGVSLERIDVQTETNNKANWQSAAKTYGYGTPTTRNSQYFNESPSSQISIEPEVFTPNEDGVDDFCLINFNGTEPGQNISITVYDALGHEVKLLAQNQTTGNTNVWKWDGTNNNFEKANVGIYIIVLEWYAQSGKKNQEKTKVVLGTRF